LESKDKCIAVPLPPSVKAAPTPFIRLPGRQKRDLAHPLPVYFYEMTNPLKKVCKKAVEAFKDHSKCKPAGDDAVAGFVRYKGNLYHILASDVDEPDVTKEQEQGER
jgi:hypothetical protein